MTGERYSIARVPIGTVAAGERPAWTKLRRELGVEAFGINAWTATADGQVVIGEHDETRLGHEELYVVVSGHAIFTVGGDEVDAPAGTAVFVSDPETARSAVGRVAGTTIVVVGAKAGEAFTPSAWESGADGISHLERQEYDAAVEAFAAALAEHPGDPGLLYNLACAESLAGDADAALGHLATAVSLDERLAGHAQNDPDFAPIRAEERFAALAGAAR